MNEGNAPNTSLKGTLRRDAAPRPLARRFQGIEMSLEKPEQFELKVLEQFLREFERLENPAKNFISPRVWCLIAAILLLAASFLLNRINLFGAYWQGALCVMAGIFAAYAGILGYSSASMRIIRPYIDIERLQLRQKALEGSLNEKT